jgi:DNA-binding MarR family transcriptional regulator
VKFQDGRVNSAPPFDEDPQVADADDPAELAAQVDAVLAASRVLVGISASSISAVEATVTLPQLRTLVVLASLATTNLATLAEAMGVHASNATRACDRLVALGLVDRRDNPEDRRNVTLTLTDSGQRTVATVMNARRAAIRRTLRRMPSAQRSQLAQVLGEFAAAAGEQPASQLWAMGWTTER